MDEFINDLQNQLQPKTETVTLERILKFYNYLKSQKWSGSIIYYEGEHSVWANTHGNGLYEGHGKTIDDALNDISNDFQRLKIKK